jgi:hypothetical protein
MMASSAHVAWGQPEPVSGRGNPDTQPEGPARGYSAAKGLDDHLLVLL